MFAKIKNVDIKFDKSFPASAKDLVIKLLRADPADRISL